MVIPPSIVSVVASSASHPIPTTTTTHQLNKGQLSSSPPTNQLRTTHDSRMPSEEYQHQHQHHHQQKKAHIGFNPPHVRLPKPPTHWLSSISGLKIQAFHPSIEGTPRHQRKPPPPKKEKLKAIFGHNPIANQATSLIFFGSFGLSLYSVPPDYDHNYI